MFSPEYISLTNMFPFTDESSEPSMEPSHSKYSFKGELSGFKIYNDYTIFTKFIIYYLLQN